MAIRIGAVTNLLGEGNMPTQARISVPEDLLVDLSRGFGALTEAIEGHEKRDNERHTEICGKLDGFSTRVAKLEADATVSGQHKAVQDALDAKKKERWGFWEKVLTAVFGAALAGAGGLIHHLLGWK